MSKKRLLKWLVPVGGACVLGLLLLWQLGVFHRVRYPAGRTHDETMHIDGTPYTVEMQRVPEYFRTAGTAISRTHVDISARIVARITDVLARSGDTVTNGMVLIRLDDADIRADANRAAEGVRSALAGVSAAEEKVQEATAAYELASVEVERMRQLFASGTVSRQALDNAESQYRQTRALVAQAEQSRIMAQSAVQSAEESVRQAEAVLDYTVLRSPIDAIVAERLADPGDLASPGKILMRLFDPTRLMLEVPVREGLVRRITIGEEVPFYVGALDTTFYGEIREIVPAIDPGSRTFNIKICIADAESVVPGMFGVLSLPMGERDALLVPEEAITRTGQLEFVREKKDGRVRRTLVRTRPAREGYREVVSGLQPGAVVLK